MQREALQLSQVGASGPNQPLSQVTTSIDSLVARLSAYLNRSQPQHTVPPTPPSTASAGGSENDDYVDREIARWEKKYLVRHCLGSGQSQETNCGTCVQPQTQTTHLMGCAFRHE